VLGKGERSPNISIAKINYSGKWADHYHGVAPSRERLIVNEEFEEKLLTDMERTLAPESRLHSSILADLIQQLKDTARDRLWSTHTRLLEETSEFTRVVDDCKIHPDVARVMELSLDSAEAYILSGGSNLEPWFSSWRFICAQLVGQAKFFGSGGGRGVKTTTDFLDRVIKVLQLDSRFSFKPPVTC